MSQLWNWCQPHWDELRRHIDDRGLTPWVSKGGDMAADAMRRDFEDDGKGQFDPLLRAYFAINSRIQDATGDPFTCPLCQVQSHDDECTKPDCSFKVSIVLKGCCDAMLEMARDARMVPGVELHVKDRPRAVVPPDEEGADASR